MDGDDAPHAGDDSGKHGAIFAGIQGLLRSYWTLTPITTVLKLVASRHVSPYP